MLSGEQRPGVASAGEPLFSRYLFVELDVPEQQVAHVRNLPGVCAVMQLGGRYAPVPEAVVAFLAGRRELPEAGLSLLDGLHRLTDGAARALALVEWICQPPRSASVAGLLIAA
jgi:transcription antitermination factor NusG